MSKYSVVLGFFKLPIPSVPSGYIYVYKVTCELTQEYYIGQTEDIKRRAYRHLSCIKKTMKGIECMAFPFHKSIAKTLKEWTSAHILEDADRVITKYVSMEILAILPNKKKADEYEYSVISKLDKLCLNRRYS